MEVTLVYEVLEVSDENKEECLVERIEERGLVGITTRELTARLW